MPPCYICTDVHFFIRADVLSGGDLGCFCFLTCWPFLASETTTVFFAVLNQEQLDTEGIFLFIIIISVFFRMSCEFSSRPRFSPGVLMSLD